MRELIGALRRAGHDVLECALVPKAQGDATTGGGGGVSFWRHLRLPRLAVEWLEVLYNRKGRAMLRTAARAFRPDFVYERHALHCRAGLDVAKELGVPLLLEVNSPMVDEMEKLRLLRLPRRARATERRVLGGADRVLAVTRVLGDMLVERGARAECVRIVPNGAQPERYDDAARARGRALRQRLGLGDDAFVLGFVGYMRPWHRLDLVLEIMGRPGLAAVHLMLVGDGPALPELRAAAARLSLGDRFHALGVVGAADLPAHVCAFDAALVPAINAYASPLKLFDSLAAGVPTLAPDQPNLRELVVDGRNGLLFTPGSADALQQRLQPLVADRRRGRELGAAGRQSLLDAGWTWDGNAARIAAIAAELGAGARR